MIDLNVNSIELPWFRRSLCACDAETPTLHINLPGGRCLGITGTEGGTDIKTDSKFEIRD